MCLSDWRRKWPSGRCTPLYLYVTTTRVLRYSTSRILMTYSIVSWCIWIVILIQKIRFVKNQTYLVSNWTISDPKEFSFLKINLHWEIENSRTFLEIWFLTEHFSEFLRFLKSREDFQQVENKYLEISKVWSYTEKILTKIIYAREAEQSIKDFYFDQVVELRQVFLSFWLDRWPMSVWPMSV